jgi:hypothetical protein
LVGSGFQNPSPGTVVDHTITRKKMFDFFLCSQKVSQGTATPTHLVSDWSEMIRLFLLEQEQKLILRLRFTCTTKVIA